MSQRLQDEDQVELDVHFAERVQAYLEIGETSEQAQISARQKFGEVKAVRRELLWRKALRHQVLVVLGVGLCWLVAWCPLGLPTLAALIRWRHDADLLGEQGPLLTFYIVASVTLAIVPTALLSVLQKKTKQRNAHGLGMLLASLLVAPTHDLLVALPGALGVVYVLAMLRWCQHREAKTERVRSDEPNKKQCASR
jgi:hypothetical protein